MKAALDELNCLKGGDDFFPLVALFRENFSIDWLVSLTGEKASRLLSLLEGGVQSGCLASHGIGIYSFQDGKKQKAWARHFTPEAAAQKHGEIARLLLTELPEGEEKILALSYHLQRTRCDAGFCRLLMNAGDIYRRTFGTKEALACYSKILDDLSGQEEEETDEVFIETSIRYSKISTAPRPERLKIISVLEEALARATKGDKKNYQALLNLHLAKNEWICSQYDQALRHFDEGWSLAKRLDEKNLLRLAHTFAIYFSFWQGRFAEVIRHYETFAPDVQIYPQGRFPLLAALLVGYCYALVGQTSQGLGMLDAIYTQCEERGDSYMSATARVSMGVIMLDRGKTDQALQYIGHWSRQAKKDHNDWIWIWGELALALAYFLKKEQRSAVAHLQEFLKASEQVQITIRPYSFMLELCWAMEKGELPPIPGLSLEKELTKAFSGKNVFLQGVACRYKALLQIQKEAPSKEIMDSLRDSVKFLAESGHQVQGARSQLELARHCLLSGNEQEAKELAGRGAKVLSSENAEFFPEDLKALTNDNARNESLLNEILRSTQEIATLRDNKELAQHIISTVNRITGAERGAIFLWEEHSPPRLRLRASRNLTSEQVSHPHFHSSMEMIQEAAETRRGKIWQADFNEGGPPPHVIRSRICVPMVIRDKVVGVLYHDNRLLSSAFKESDLEILSFYSAQAAIALDNARSYEKMQAITQKLREEKLYYEEQHLQNLHFEDIVGESEAIREVLEKVEQVSNTNATVLIFGETGVGKELVARAIHRYSHRRDKPFIRVLCSALPESLIPSELFGHEKGAFTGATRRRIGRFELADRGTLFLDEIGDLPLEIQVRLLRVLQSKEFERVGGSEPIQSDFRLLAATNRDLDNEVKELRFRSDLFYRINVFPIYVPPLRERPSDIPLLAHYFLKNYATKMGKVFEGIPNSEMQKLLQYDWPGNIRELENIIERGVILSNDSMFHVPQLIKDPLRDRENSAPTLKENERRHILWALRKTGWKIRGRGGAAELLEIHPSTLAFRMGKLGIQRRRKYPGRKRPVLSEEF